MFAAASKSTRDQICDTWQFRYSWLKAYHLLAVYTVPRGARPSEYPNSMLAMLRESARPNSVRLMATSKSPWADLQALVIDDQPEVRHYVRRTLRTMGIPNVTDVAGGREACWP